MNCLSSVRHQILMPEQQAVFDYWRKQCLSKGLPSHKDIDPSVIQPYLPTVSLTEICPSEETSRFKLRLAGTGFYSLYDREVTGMYVDELPVGDRADYWSRIYSAMIKARRPRVGVTRPGTPNGGHMLQFWLRLPLSCDGTNVNMILGFDKFVKRTQLKNEITALKESRLETTA